MAEPIYRSIDNGYGELIAVGGNGLILHSTDSGTTWNGRNSGTSEHLYGAAYGDAFGETIWLVVGANGTILKSANGILWYPIANSITEDLYDIAFGGIFITVGTNGLMASSEDFGQNWFFNESGTTEDLHGITIDFSNYIIVGANDTTIVGELLSVNFNIEVIERFSVQRTGSVSEQVSEDALTEEFQVASPAGGRVAAQQTSYVLTGPVTAGDVFRVTLDGVNYDYTVVGGDTTLSDIVAGLVALIDPSTKFYAYELDGSPGTLIVGSDGPPTEYTYSASMQVDPGADNTITPAIVQDSSTMKITAEITGTVETGDLFQITIDGSTYNYTTDVGDVTNADIADGWVADNAAALDAAGFTVSAAAGVITIESHDPERGFPYSYSTTNGGAVDDQDVTMAESRSALLAGMTYYDGISDSVFVNEETLTPLGVYNHEITEIVDTLDTFIGGLATNHAITDGFVATDTIAFTFANGVGGELSLIPLSVSGELLVSNSVSGNLSLPSLKILGSLIRELGGDLVLPMLSVDGVLGPNANIVGDLILPRLEVAGQLIVKVDDTEYVVWVINQDNKAHSNYTDFKANSLGVFNGIDIIATEDGIYELRAGEDDTEGAIDARITWVPTDYGVPTVKRLDAAYVNMRHATGGIIRTVADENEERIYECDMSQHASGMHKKRVLFVRGLAAEYWQIGFESTQGRFTLGDIEVTPVASKRRIK